jgi:pimeloyl-ACP methyl ester carboxylesterase
VILAPVTNNQQPATSKSLIIIMKTRINKTVILLSVIITLIFSGFGKTLNAQPGKGWQAPKDVVDRLSANQPGINYYEDRVVPYTLPDPLTTSSGRKIVNSRLWVNLRRDEILELFRENVFGRIPETSYSESFRMENEDKAAMGGIAVLKQIVITIEAGGSSLDIHLTLFVPVKAKKPVPAFLVINNRDKSIGDPTRKVKSEFWPAEEIIARGYAAAIFSNADVDPDNFDNFKNGIHGLLDGGSRKPDSWGTIAAWAWGASRCMDYFLTDTDIDNAKVAVVGHSRGGKTALWAGAEDQRFALVISNESGCGGAALARRRYGETVARINASFPHWFCSNYTKWADNEDNMPVDMHMLLALIAPRALYVDCADEDLWGDPYGSYLSLYSSLPVYRLFDSQVSLPEEMPPLNHPVTSRQIGFHIRDGAHNMLLKDWNWFMDFADVLFR